MRFFPNLAALLLWAMFGGLSKHWITPSTCRIWPETLMAEVGCCCRWSALMAEGCVPIAREWQKGLGLQVGCQVSSHCNGLSVVSGFFMRLHKACAAHQSCAEGTASSTLCHCCTFFSQKARMSLAVFALWLCLCSCLKPNLLLCTPTHLNLVRHLHLL